MIEIKKNKSLLSQVVMVMTTVLFLSVGLLYLPTFFKFRHLIEENYQYKLKFSALKLADQLKNDFSQAPLEEIPLEKICRDGFPREMGVVIFDGRRQRTLAYGLASSEVQKLLASLPQKELILFSSGKNRALFISLSGDRSLLIRLPNRSAQRFVSYLFLLAILMIGSLLFAGSIMIYALYKIVLKPLEDLIVANLGTIEGKPEYLLIPPSNIPNNEIGETMRHRNRLIIKLKEFQQKIEEQNQELRANQDELKKWSKDLEARVESKTRELKAAEEHLIRAEKQTALGKLASGVAHEVNNPLASIAGYAEDMIETLNSKGQFTAEEIAEFTESLQIIEDQAYRLKDLTRKLLNFARETELNIDEVDLNQLIGETISLVALKSRKKLPLTQELDPQTPPICTDRAKLQQVLMNLLDNGVDALENGGEMRVITRVESDQVRIIVSDSGCGIPKGIRVRIFDPFFTTKPVGKGTGLGLSICYGLIKKLKGTIELAEGPMAGANFVVTLPLVGEEEEEEPLQTFEMGA